MCQKRSSSVEALKFLQNQVSAVVNHDRAEESQQLRSLSSLLFQKPSQSSPFASPLLIPNLNGGPEESVRARVDLFEAVVNLLAKRICPPVLDIVDLVPVSVKQ
jgi:muskelin